MSNGCQMCYLGVYNLSNGGTIWTLGCTTSSHLARCIIETKTYSSPSGSTAWSTSSTNTLGSNTSSTNTLGSTLGSNTNTLGSNTSSTNTLDNTQVVVSCGIFLKTFNSIMQGIARKLTLAVLQKNCTLLQCIFPPCSLRLSIRPPCGLAWCAMCM